MCPPGMYKLKTRFGGFFYGVRVKI